MAKSTLDALYPIVYMDCIVVKVRQDSTIINKAGELYRVCRRLFYLS